MSPIRAVAAIAPIVDAVAALHATHRVHRDVKTKNIFLRHNGDLVLGDLGSVLDLTKERLTDYSSPLSKHWIPPWSPSDMNTYEQDVYMLAKVLYVMVFGDKTVQPGFIGRHLKQVEWLQDSKWASFHELLLTHIVGDGAGILGARPPPSSPESFATVFYAWGNRQRECCGLGAAAAKARTSFSESSCRLLRQKHVSSRFIFVPSNSTIRAACR